MGVVESGPKDTHSEAQSQLSVTKVEFFLLVFVLVLSTGRGKQLSISDAEEIFPSVILTRIMMQWKILLGGKKSKCD